ncbi:MAG: ATP-binding protein [Janthinobacterium lividum]
MPAAPVLTSADADFPPELLPTLLDVSLAAVLLLRPVYAPGGDEPIDFALEYLSPAAQRSLGHSARPGGTVRTHFPHAPASGVLDFYCRVFRTSQAARAAFPYQADGLDSYFYVAAQRQGPWLVVSFTDTAEQPRSAIEEALRASQAHERATWAAGERQRQRLLGLLFQAPVLVAILFGPTHQIELANEGFRQAFGHRPLVGRTYREAAPELAGQHLFERLDEVYHTGESFQASEWLVHLDRTNSGRLDPCYYNFIYQATLEADGQVSGVCIIATEVTSLVVSRQQVQELNQELSAAIESLQLSNLDLEQQVADRTHALLMTLQQLEQRRRQLTQALAAEQELGELKTRFVSMASHEFRTPLTTVLTSAELIADYPAVDQQTQRLRHVAHIRTAVAQLNDLLEEFLSVGRLEEGKVVTNPARLYPAALLAETVAAVQGLRKAGQNIVQQTDCPDPIRLDASLLRKILLNLLTNALKYSGENSVVTLRAECRDNQLTIRVADQGVGISPADQAHLFERFFRARSAAQVPGTGLGLYIIARYLELMGGHITLTSELGVGTTFTVTIPDAHHTTA